MATVRAPNRDFTLGIPASMFPMSYPVDPEAGVIITETPGTAIPQPQCAVLCEDSGGGGASNGVGYASF